MKARCRRVKGWHRSVKRPRTRATGRRRYDGHITKNDGRVSERYKGRELRDIILTDAKVNERSKDGKRRGSPSALKYTFVTPKKRKGAREFG